MDSADALAVKPAEPSWAEEVAALTGWSGDRRLVDWGSAERELGLCLPQDYKLLAETFGAGTFDDSLNLCVPGSQPLTLQLVTAGNAEFGGPAPSEGPTLRLLQWATTSAGHSFCWLADDPDPEKWPVFASSDKWDPWERFDCSAGEFLHRMLSDPQHPYTLTEYFETHWFTSATEVEQAEEAFDDEYYPHW